MRHRKRLFNIYVNNKKNFLKGMFYNDMQYCPYLKGAPIKKYNRSKLRKPENLMIINLEKNGWLM